VRDPGAAAKADTPDSAAGLPILRAAALETAVPGLVAGITARLPGGGRGQADDFGLSTGGSSWSVAERYEALARGLGLGSASVCRQVHGTGLVAVEDAPPAGVWIPGEADGFFGATPRRLFAVTVADCVPVYLVEPETRAFALLHAGWRGAAAGILERTLEALRTAHGLPASAFRLHLGPAICGDCYEVGPEVPRAFGRAVEGDEERTTLDVGGELIARALEAGVGREISRSRLCTRCDDDRLHSHRGAGARAGRMAAYVGWIP